MTGIHRTVRRASLLAVAVIAVLLPSLQAGASPATGDRDPNGGGRAAADRPAGAHAEAGATPPAGYPVRGIDVSWWDHPNGASIDWLGQSAGGVRFAYIKATENTDYTNTYFASDLAAAKRSGMFAGAYAFGRPDQPDPAAQADFFFANMHWSRDGLTLPPFVDMEWPWFPGVNSCYDLTPAQMSAWLHTFLDTLQGHIGRRPVIYTAASWWNQCVGADPSFGRYRLDVSSCRAAPVLPASWSHWTFWQWTIPGCGGPAYDRDVYHGSLAGLALLANLDVDRPAGTGAGGSPG